MHTSDALVRSFLAWIVVFAEALAEARSAQYRLVLSRRLLYPSKAASAFSVQGELWEELSDMMRQLVRQRLQNRWQAAELRNNLHGTVIRAWRDPRTLNTPESRYHLHMSIRAARALAGSSDQTCQTVTRSRESSGRGSFRRPPFHPL